ncbi:MAG: hypothetical protein NTX59_08395 [Elusimicrobia bacterium]|nr:hypothetical protein [Elusimicrobiota bacterium]
MITFKPYQHLPIQVKALHYTGTLNDAGDLESLYKGKVHLEFRGIFTGCIMVDIPGGRLQRVMPGDFLIDSPILGLYAMTTEDFIQCYEAHK